MLTREISKLLADRYLDGQDAAQPLASPVNADFTGVSPILIQIGSGEALLSDAMNLALAAAKSDVKVVLDVWPEMLHAWLYSSERYQRGALPWSRLANSCARISPRESDAQSYRRAASAQHAMSSSDLSRPN